MTTSTPTATSRQVLGAEIGEGLRGILREPTALFFSVLMPVMLFALFASLFGAAPTPDGIPTAARMLASFGTFGVVSVMLMNPGIGVANDRASGWLRVKKVSAAPISITIVGRVLSALPYAVFVLLAFTALSLAIAGPVMSFDAWGRMVLVLIIGSLPFALLGLAIGFVTSANAAAAVLNAVFFPLSIASGLWMPLEILPAWIQNIAPYLPTYHLARLAVAQLTGGPALGHLLALLVTTAVAGGLAAWAYRNLRT
jgi:ABC-2 type transport system permease protein